MENYFNYFTEIEEHFQRRRGSILLLSTLDWALIETWRDAGIPLEAVLRGIDTAFDRYDAEKRVGVAPRQRPGVVRAGSDEGSGRDAGSIARVWQSRSRTMRARDWSGSGLLRI